ncbi:hypothetical protein JYT27_00285 [bacterium AH-315-D21]|nr:hypothetical protein [bacterium AH-315-D21]
MALKLVLDELGVPLRVKSLADRKTLQKSVYISQRLFPPLGYSFNWYLMGPYSPSLARDYYDLMNDPRKESATAGFGLNDSVTDKIRQVRKWIPPPEGVELKKAEWLELLASVAFLNTNSDKAKADAILQRSKPELYPERQAAYDALKDLGLS